MRLLGQFLAKIIVHCTQEAIFSPSAKTIKLFSAAICPRAVKNTVEERYDLLNIALCVCVCTLTYVVISYCRPLVLIISMV